jgi:hypothetical protein
MMRALRCFVLLVVCGALGIQEASAHIDDWWGWLEEFSGPGPFKGFSMGQQFCWEDPTLVTTAEVGARIERQTHLGDLPLVLGTPGGTAPCLWLDQKFLESGPRFEFPETTAQLYDGGLLLSFQRSVSVGAGIGLIHFVSKRPIGDFGRTRFVITPIRISLSPAIVLARSSRQADPKWKWVGVVKMTGKIVLVPGRLSGRDDFGIPTSTFEVHNDHPLSFGLQLDFLELESAVRALFQ